MLRGMIDLDLSCDLIHVDGRPVWLFADGTVLPYVAGGSEDGGDGGGDGGGQGGGDAGGTSGQGGAGDGAGSGSGDGSGDGAPAKLEMTQAEFDKAIEARLARAKTSWEKDAKTAADRAKLDDVERLKAEKADAEKAAAEATTAAQRTLIKAEAKLAAAAAKVPADRISAFMKLADLGDVAVDDSGDVDSTALDAAVKKTLAENPFLLSATAANSGGASGGDHNGSGSDKVWTKAEVDALSVEEFEKHETEIMASMRAHGGLK